jgi:hypothetical protein
MTLLPVAANPLPHPLPGCANAQIALFAMRRMGAFGLADARAAHAMLRHFGVHFRRPLTLMRAFMHDMAANSAVSLQIAPCCCGRMTSAEAAMLTVLARVEDTPETARLLLGDLLALRRPDGVLASAQALARAFDDAGCPIAEPA